MAVSTSKTQKKKGPLPLIIGGAVVLGGVVAFFIFHHGDDSSGPSKKEEIHMISLPPPPPPPPPPPKVEPPKPEEQKFQKEDTEKPPEKAPEPAPAPIATSIQGNDASGLGVGNGGGGGSGFGGTGGGGSKFGYYAGQVKSRVLDTLRSHKKTRSAVMNVTARFWIDPTGRVSRVTITPSTGDAALDAAIKTEVFSSVTLQEPPEGMPMPIVMKFNAHRPN